MNKKDLIVCNHFSTCKSKRCRFKHTTLWQHTGGFRYRGENIVKGRDNGRITCEDNEGCGIIRVPLCVRPYEELCGVV